MRTTIAILLATLACGCSIEKITEPWPESPPYGEFVREIRLEGNGYTRDWIILAAMASTVGEPYTESTARRDFLWLSQLGAFTSVNFETEPADDGITLIVRVAEVTPYIPSVSFALTQENGVELGPAFSSANLFGFAARASAYARFGGATNFGLRYWDPWLPGKNWLVGYRLEYFHRDRINELDDFPEVSDEISFQFERNPTNNIALGVRALYLTVASDSSGNTLSPTNRDKIPAAGLYLRLDTRNAAYPTNGWLAEFEASKYGIFGGDSDYWHFGADLRRYIPLPIGRRHSLALYSLGTMSTGVVGVDIPIYMDYHIGGTNTVRGWPLGSRVGKNQWLNTVEYWFRLIDERKLRAWFIKWRMGLQLGAFGDVGTAWDTSEEFGDNFIGGIGGGLRITIPVVVMLRLDVGYSSNKFGIQLHVGGAEKQQASRNRVR